MTDRPSLRDIISRHGDAVMALPGVVGIAAGRDPDDPSQPCLILYLSSKEVPEELPTELEGVPVRISRTGGDFRPL